MNKKFIGVLLVAGLMLTSCGDDGNVSSGDFAVVNGKTISQETYDSQLDMYSKMLANQYQLPASIENSLITEAAMVAELEANDIEITEEDYQEDYNTMVQNRGGQEAYDTFLSDMGITDEQMKTSLRYETIHRVHNAWYLENNTPSDEEMQSFFERNKASLITVDASHILVATEEEAQEVLDRLNSGEDFGTLAQELSTDTGSAINGGNLGESAPNLYVPEFQDALLNMEEGEISEPVQSQFGYHIIRLEKMNDDFESLKESIAQQMTQQSYQEYLQQLVANADVEKTGEDANGITIEEVDPNTELNSSESGN